MKRTKLITAIALASILAPLTGVAADYPSRPVKYVVPWPPGDLEDVLTRLIAEEMSKETGKPATVVNKPGGAGLLAQRKFLERVRMASQLAHLWPTF